MQAYIELPTTRQKRTTQEVKIKLEIKRILTQIKEKHF